MTDTEKLVGIKKAIRQIIRYPKKGHHRRTEDGYPLEMIYDELAYHWMVKSYRVALEDVLKDFK